MPNPQASVSQSGHGSQSLERIPRADQIPHTTMFTTAYTNRWAWKSRRFLTCRSAWSRSASGLSPTTSSYNSVLAMHQVHHREGNLASAAARKRCSAFYDRRCPLTAEYHGRVSGSLAAPAEVVLTHRLSLIALPG